MYAIIHIAGMTHHIMSGFAPIVPFSGEKKMLILQCPRCFQVLVEDRNNDRHECPHCGLILNEHSVREAQCGAEDVHVTTCDIERLARMVC